MKLAVKAISLINEAYGKEDKISSALKNIDKQFGKNKTKDETPKFEPLVYSDGKKSPAVDLISSHKELKHLTNALDQFLSMNKRGETSFRNNLIKKTEDKIAELKPFMVKNKWMDESLSEDADKKPVNYTVKAALYFDDGQNSGNMKVKAVDAKEAEKLAREKLKDTWDKKGTLKKIEIISVKKG